MLPLVVAEQIRHGVSDFLAATFPGTTPGFDGMMARFLAQPGSLVRGPYPDLRYSMFVGRVSA